MIYTYQFYRSHLKTSTLNITELVRKLFSNEEIKSRFPDKVRQNIELYIANLIYFKNGIAIPKDCRWFNKEKHTFNTYRLSKIAIELLINRSYIEKILNGYKSKGFKKGFATCYARTLLFEETFGSISPKELEVDDSNMAHEYKESKKDKDNINTNTVALVIRSDSNAENTHFLKTTYFNRIKLSHSKTTKLDIYTNVELRRIYTLRGNIVAGGRFYQKGGKSYLQLDNGNPKNGVINTINRNGLLINGKETSEIDFSCIHINLLYNLPGLKSPYKDNYKAVLDELKVSSKELRDVIKHIMLIIINAKDYKTFKISFNKKQERRDMIKLLKANNLDLDMVLTAFKKVHPRISQFINSDAGIYLQRHDSNIMENILLRLHKENILGVPLHDSIRFIKSDNNIIKVKQIMQEEYLKYTGFTIGVKIE